jgi:acylphosphatase
VRKAITVIATGNIQGVGFRKAVQQLAKKSNLVGHVENLSDGNVSILAQGEDSEIEIFLGNIRMLPDPVKVDDLAKSSIPLNSTLKGFEIKYGNVGQELDESLSAGLLQLKTLTGEISEFRASTSQDFRTLNTKYDSISNTLAKVVQQSAETSNDLKKSIDSLPKSLDSLSLLAQEYFEDQRKEFARSSNVSSDKENWKLTR